MGRSIMVLMLGSLLFVQSACSVVWALKQPPPKDLEGLGIGTSRELLIQRLGMPKWSETDSEGRRQEMFEFVSGMHQASKLRALLYAGADFVTVCFAELVLWPMELTVMKDATCNVFATYDSSDMVNSWVMKKASQTVTGC